MYYITVSNGLLKNGHRKRMGAAVWEFMWLIDKITKIDNRGFGLVLGGKPIKLEDIASDLEVHRDTVSANLASLEEEGYITKITAPHGIAIKVAKAKKRFGDNAEPGTEKTPNLVGKTPNLIKTIQKTKQLDITAPSADGVLVNQFVSLFQGINPAYHLAFKRPAQRQAAQRLLDLHGLEKLEKVIGYIAANRNRQYFPTIATPCQLEEKWAALENFAARQKSELSKKTNIAFL